MCLTDKIFLQMHVTFCEYLVFYEFKRNLYITLAKYLEQEGIANLLFSICLYTVFLSSELISWDDSSRLLDDTSDMFFIAPCLGNLSDISVSTAELVALLNLIYQWCCGIFCFMLTQRQCYFHWIPQTVKWDLILSITSIIWFVAYL